MKEEQPNYFAIIPATVRYDEKIIPNAKLLYGEITCLSNKEGYCYASNNYFAKLYHVTNQAVSRWIKSLVDGGYISTQLIYEGKEIKERRIYILDIGINKKLIGVSKKSDEGYQYKVKDNNINNNNININNMGANAPAPSQKEKSDLQTLKEIYMQNYTSLYERGYVKLSTPVMDWNKAIHNLKGSVAKYGFETIKKAIEKSKNNEFCVSKGYSLLTILSTTILSELINGTDKKIQGSNRELGPVWEAERENIDSPAIRRIKEMARKSMEEFECNV